MKNMMAFMSIKYKLSLPLIILIAIINVVFGLVYYQNSKNYLRDKVMALNKETVDQTANSIESLLSDAQDISTFLCINKDVQTLVSIPFSGPSIPNDVTYQNFRSMDFTKYIYGSKNDLSCIVIYGQTENPVFYSTTEENTYPNTLSGLSANSIYGEILALKGAPVWFIENAGDGLFLHHNLKPMIVLGRAVKDTSYARNEGVLFIGIDENAAVDICRQAVKYSNDEILIVDSQNNILIKSGSTTNEKNIIAALPQTNSGNITVNVSGDNVLASFSTIPDTGWRIVYSYPESNIISVVSSQIEIIFLAITICLSFSFFIVFFLLRVITNPINALLSSMKRFQEGNFDERINIVSHDEMGNLGVGFNIMVTKIKELVERVYILQINKQELQLREREAELIALQAQINPHFLYNTLDTIYWKAYDEKKDNEISDMIYSLSRIFRLSLNRGMRYLSVALEKEIIENYLKLQKIRYKGNLNYMISFSNDIEKFTIPKLLIQPFVENAIIHGLEERQGGTIHVMGFRESNTLHFVIKDDGKGMTEDEVKSLMTLLPDASSNSSSSHSGYAIKNIIERLRLIYGTNYNLNITSVPDHGTTVEIILSIDRKEIPDDSVVSCG